MSLAEIARLHRSCWRKRAFNRRDAIGMAKRWNQDVYKCRNCRRFHLASKR